jgi:hypothetical protein
VIRLRKYFAKKSDKNLSGSAIGSSFRVFQGAEEVSIHCKKIPGDCCLKANCSLNFQFRKFRLQFAFKQQSPDKSTVEKQHK